jgi:hypothetical protein
MQSGSVCAQYSDWGMPRADALGTDAKSGGDVLQEEIVGFVDKSHSLVVTTCVGVETFAHDSAPALKALGVDFGVEIEELPVGFFFVPGAELFDCGEEIMGEARETFFKTAVINFVPEFFVGDIAGYEEEDVALVEVCEAAECVKEIGYTGVAHPQDACAFKDRGACDLEFKVINGDLRKDFHGIQVNLVAEAGLHHKMW